MRKISNAAKMINLLAQNPDQVFTVADFVTLLRVPACTAPTQIGHLVRAGMVKRVGRGAYQGVR